MKSSRLSRAAFIVALGFAELASVVLVPRWIIETNAQEPLSGSKPPPDSQPASQPASYYQNDSDRQKQRGLDQGQVDKAQDRYYRQQVKDAKVQRDKMDREAEKYYGRP